MQPLAVIRIELDPAVRIEVGCASIWIYYLPGEKGAGTVMRTQLIIAAIIAASADYQGDRPGGPAPALRTRLQYPGSIQREEVHLSSLASR